MRDTSAVEALFLRRASKVNGNCTLRLVVETQEHMRVRQDVPLPVQRLLDVGAMVTVQHSGGLGYAATCDLSEQGIDSALAQAQYWAEVTGRLGVFNAGGLVLPVPGGSHETPVHKPWDGLTAAQRLDWLLRLSGALRTDSRMVDWEASFWQMQTRTVLLRSGDGARGEQCITQQAPVLAVTASEGSETQTRTLGGRGVCQQGGLEVMEALDLDAVAPQLAEEALVLLGAPNCPEGDMDLVLWPDQMILQIHESIGHPIELDRILGDERNYAGTSFVTPDMFGSYQYGSELLNVSFDPGRVGEFASYAFDDEGAGAGKVFVIKDGVLQQPLGGTVSQFRSGQAIAGMANARASSWNRPPIDRMANLNLEPPAEEPGPSVEDLIAGVDDGVLMKSNCSWSIDDSRNKFQFGCEWGQRIRGGKLAEVVKKPNYRGVSATFWRQLKAVGGAATADMLGSPYCGKGEPNQCIRVGHASPVCVFGNVAVFGGE